MASLCAPPKTVLANQRVLWLGDSITQDGRYVTFIEYYLSKEFSSEKFDIVSIGLSSETVSGLSEKTHPFPRPDVHERLKRAIELVKPTIVVACYGMNDGIYYPQSPERMRSQTSTPEFNGVGSLSEHCPPDLCLHHSDRNDSSRLTPVTASALVSSTSRADDG